MKYILKIVRISLLPAIAAMMILSSCNKLPEQIQGQTQQVQTGISLGATIAATADYTFYLALITRGGLLDTINNTSTSYTMFVPGETPMRIFVNAASGGAIPINAPSAVILSFINTTIPVLTANAIVSYNILPQVVRSADIDSTFPNLQYPSIFNPAPQVSALLRLTTFPSSRNGFWVNNIPIIAANIEAANGIIHQTAFLSMPPQRAVWERINTDSALTIFRTAVIRADSGTVTPPPTETPSNLQSALASIGVNFTVFAPTNSAMKNFISFITQGFIPVGAPDSSFIDFLNSPLISTQQVKGIVVYHIFDNMKNTTVPRLFNQRPGRAFLVNFPTTQRSFYTLLNSADVVGFTYPPVTLALTLSGLSVSSATIKGHGNPIPSNVILNPTPDIMPSYGNAPPATPIPYTGTSDQLYTNAVLQEIDQTLSPF